MKIKNTMRSIRLFSMDNLIIAKSNFGKWMILMIENIIFCCCIRKRRVNLWPIKSKINFSTSIVLKMAKFFHSNTNANYFLLLVLTYSVLIIKTFISTKMFKRLWLNNTRISTIAWSLIFLSSSIFSLFSLSLVSTNVR